LNYEEILCRFWLDYLY